MEYHLLLPARNVARQKEARAERQDGDAPSASASVSQNTITAINAAELGDADEHWGCKSTLGNVANDNHDDEDENENGEDLIGSKFTSCLRDGFHGYFFVWPFITPSER